MNDTTGLFITIVAFLFFCSLNSDFCQLNKVYRDGDGGRSTDDDSLIDGHPLDQCSRMEVDSKPRTNRLQSGEREEEEGDEDEKEKETRVRGPRRIGLQGEGKRRSTGNGATGVTQKGNHGLVTNKISVRRLIPSTRL